MFKSRSKTHFQSQKLYGTHYSNILNNSSTSEENTKTNSTSSYKRQWPRSSRIKRVTSFSDEGDFESWNPESIPLLQRTIDQAKSLGVKRTLSWMAGRARV